MSNTPSTLIEAIDEIALTMIRLQEEIVVLQALAQRTSITISREELALALCRDVHEHYDAERPCPHARATAERLVHQIAASRAGSSVLESAPDDRSPASPRTAGVVSSGSATP